MGKKLGQMCNSLQRFAPTAVSESDGRAEACFNPMKRQGLVAKMDVPGDLDFGLKLARYCCTPECERLTSARHRYTGNRRRTLAYPKRPLWLD